MKKIVTIAITLFLIFSFNLVFPSYNKYSDKQIALAKTRFYSSLPCDLRTYNQFGDVQNISYISQKINGNFKSPFKYNHTLFDKSSEAVIEGALQKNDFRINPLLKVRTAAAHYGEDIGLLKNLSGYADLLIVQTRFLNKNVVNKIANKELVAGYVSVLEFYGTKSDFEKYHLQNALIGKIITGTQR